MPGTAGREPGRMLRAEAWNLQVALGNPAYIHGSPHAPLDWPPISGILADEVLLGAKSGALTYRDAWHLIGVEAFRGAEAREARGNAVV